MKKHTLVSKKEIKQVHLKSQNSFQNGTKSKDKNIFTKKKDFKRDWELKTKS